MHVVRLHRGNDGHVRQLCGSRINSVISRPKINEVLHALDSRRRDVHGHVCIVWPDLDYKKNMAWGGSSWGSFGLFVSYETYKKRPSFGRPYLVYHLWFFYRENLLATEGWSSHQHLRADPRGSLFLFVHFHTRVKIVLGGCKEDQGDEPPIKYRRERSGHLRAQISISLVRATSRLL